MLGKIEELKVSNLKKFADKQETSKNFKYLDLSIKQINEVNQKRLEKGENWLIAKKPFGGNSCASCEAFIGDLNENKDYIPWNKLKDSNDKLYRLGNGFSKMLQVVDGNSTHGHGHRHNVDDINAADTINFPTLTEDTVALRNKSHRKESLPKIKKQKILQASHSSRLSKINMSSVTHSNQFANLSMEIPEFHEKDEAEEIDQLVTEPIM